MFNTFHRPSYENQEKSEFPTPDELHQAATPDALERLFWARSTYFGGYPFVHGRATSGVFDDVRLSREMAYALIPGMANLAERVPDPYLHMALSLLCNLMPSDTIMPRPPGFSDSLLRLRLRVEKLSFLPNLVCTWDGLMVAQRALKSEDDPLAQYSPNELGLERAEWPGLSIPLHEFINDNLDDCRVDLKLLEEAMSGLTFDPEKPSLIFGTRIKATRFWVWRASGKPGTAHRDRLIYLRQPRDGDCELGYWDLYSQYSELPTKEAISRRLREIEFTLHEAMIIPSSVKS